MASFIGGGMWVPETPTVESSTPHTHVTETPPPIKALETPASNPGSDDSTGGIAEGAGGLSSTAGIGSPVKDVPEQSVVGSVFEYAFGKKERTAEEVEAAAPTTASVTAGASSGSTSEPTGSSSTYLGAIAAAGGAAVASIIPGMASTTGAEPVAVTTSPETTATRSTTAEPIAATSTSGSNAEPIATASPQATTTRSTIAESVPATTTTSEPPADVKSTSAVTGDKTTSAITEDKSTTEHKSLGEKSDTTQVKTLGEKAADATETVKASANEAAESAADTAKAASQSAKEAVSGEKSTESASKESETQDKPTTSGDKSEETSAEDPKTHDKPAKVSDHEAAIRENKDAIPTAGGEKLGAAHAGESKVVPDVPPIASEETTKVSSTAGQLDNTTASNTARNTPGAHESRAAVLGDKKSGAEGSSSSDKPKFMDRLKTKLHIGDKKDKA